MGKNNNEFKILITRGSGPGGQHKNKVETCVTIIHLPTGLSEKCQETRSKKRNLNLAKKRLLKKIDDIKLKQEHEAINQKRKKLIQNSKTVRTYNYATNIVHDHRTKVKHDLKKFMKGEIDLI